MSYDPYNPDVQDTDSETPTLNKTIQNAIQFALLDVHTGIPAKIVQVKSNQRVSVLINIKMKLTNGQVIDRPILQDVPVWMPSGQTWWLKLPIAANDVGMLMFSERSIDKWKVSGGQVDPADPRKFDLSDGVFFPGLRPFSNQIPGVASEMIFHNGSSEIVIKPDGKFKIKNSSQELLSVIDDFIDETILFVTETKSLEGQVDALRGAVDSLTGILSASGLFPPLTFVGVQLSLVGIATALGTIQSNLTSIKSDMEATKSDLEDLKG